MASRRTFFKKSGRLWGGAFVLGGAANASASAELVVGKKLNIMMKSAWGPDDPTRASFPFLHGLILAEKGHDVRIFLTGEATYLMREATLEAIVPIGWPPLRETRDKIVTKQIPVFS
jgi:hypothetical protein